MNISDVAAINDRKREKWTKYIIVQAGGRGSRLQYLTNNKPKCLVPVENRPIIFHLFEKFPSTQFIIIGDTHYDVLDKYLSSFASVNYQLVNSSGRKGTLAGLAKALELVPSGQPFMYVWCDLVLPQKLDFPDDNRNYIGISKGLKCRWSFQAGQIIEKASAENGIAGIFLISCKEQLAHLPSEGQFVKYISSFPECFDIWHLNGLREFGELYAYERLPMPVCRPFNSIEFGENLVTKTAINEQGRELMASECAWYKAAVDTQLPVPRIYKYDPIVMDRIIGCPVADMDFESIKRKSKILCCIMAELDRMHNQGICAFDEVSFKETYIDKTFARLNKVKKLIPFADKERIVINGKMCRNPFFVEKILADIMMHYIPDKFMFIHGDCTLSNILIDDKDKIYFIDPRGYFGKTRLFGDPAYDYAKLFYSISGNYDCFNKKKFRLQVNRDSVNLFIESNGWESLTEVFYNALPHAVTPRQIRAIHTVIWLSLTTYAWEDYDSICGAFYNGTLFFEESLHEHNL